MRGCKPRSDSWICCRGFPPYTIVVVPPMQLARPHAAMRRPECPNPRHCCAARLRCIRLGARGETRRYLSERCLSLSCGNHSLGGARRPEAAPGLVDSVASSQAIRGFRQSISKIDGDIGGLILVQPLCCNQLCEIGAIHPSCEVVACRNGSECARVVVEPHRIVKPGRRGRAAPVTQHCLRCVVEPPGWSQPQTGVMSGQRRQLARVSALIQREENQGEIAPRTE